MIFHPYSIEHKTPFGAVPSGTAVTFTLRPDRAEGFSDALLTARLEQDDNRVIHLPLPWVSTDYRCDVFSGVLDTSGYVGLIWYAFQLTALDGRQQELGPYLLPVYDGTALPPTWFGDGLCYQIFPDRFYRGHAALGNTPPYGPRWLHPSWAESPWVGPVGTDEQGLAQYNRDFFGGNLTGITEKLDFLAGLGVETLYLCPIFSSAENHRYSTADYERIDPLLGTEADFSALCAAAHARGMRVILDGVFSHTGATSRYFSGDGGSVPGAAQSPDSPYWDWYQWERWPNRYKSWWGIPTLPTLDKSSPSLRSYLYGGRNSIVRRWLRAGADGWRLDVADELPDDFIHELRQAVAEENPHATVLGEVWEDGVTKIAYGVRRKHLLGGHLDGLMNYPFRAALLDYLLGGDAADFREAMETLREHYPPFAFHNAMNFLGTHDTPRILTVLALGPEGAERAAGRPLTSEQRWRGLEKLKLGYLVLFTFPGAPTLYYGDEAGLEGGKDPWNRRTYPWGQEDDALLRWCCQLGQLRKKSPALRRGTLDWGDCFGGLLTFRRALDGVELATVVNAGEQEVPFPLDGVWENLLTGGCIRGGEALLPGQGGIFQVQGLCP